MITVDRISSPEQFVSLKPIWDSLLSESRFRTIFQTFEWQQCWWEALGDGHELFVLLVRSDDKVTGIAPLMRTVSSGLSGQQKFIEFIGTPNSDYCDFIGPDNENIINAVVQYLSDNRAEWTKIALSQIPEGSPSLQPLRNALKKIGLACCVDEIDSCMAYRYEPADGERESFSFPRSGNLRNAFNYFNRLGGLTCERYSDATAIKKLLPKLFHSHIMRWQFTNTPSKFNEPAQCRFYELLADRLSELGRVSLSVTTYGDTPFAYLFTYNYGNVVNLYTVTNDLYHQRKSPGIVMFHMLAENAVRDGYDEVNFARGAGQHKIRFCNRVNPNYQVTAFNGRTGYYLHTAYAKLKQTSLIRKLIANKKLKDFHTKLASYYSKHGLKSLLKTIGRNVINLTWNYKTLLIFVLDDPRRHRKIKARIDLEIKRLRREEMDTICSFLGCSHGSQKHAVIEERFENGGECWVALHEGTIASMVWALGKKDHIAEINRSYYIEEDQMILSDSFTSPIFRGHRVFPELRSEVITHYTEKNIRLYGFCLTYNKIALKSIRNVGYTLQGKIRYLRVLGIRIM